MDKNNLIVYKSNKIIEAAYKLSLNEQRLLLMCIAKINSTKPLSTTDLFEVTAKEFAQRFQISEDKAYQTLKDVSERLFERYVIIDNPDPDTPTLKYTKTRWISSIDYIPELGKVSVYFAQRMFPYLSGLTGQFTFYLLENIAAMNSIHALRLYELLMQWKTTGVREIEIDWLKTQFEIEDKYSSIKDLKKYVIDPAVKDINIHSNFQAAWIQRKTGRRVTHLTFTFAEKQPVTPKKLKKPATKSTAKPAEIKVDNIEHFADLRKRLGDIANVGIPEDIANILKAQGRW
jgi:plasmid replication initiation protein